MKKKFIVSTMLLWSLQLCCAPDYWITVFVHGSFSLKPHLNLSNVINMLRDTIEDSVYYRSTEINRQDTFFQKNQAMLPLGLHKIAHKDPNNKQAARIIANLYDDILADAGFPRSNAYYAFGWSGLVSHKLRYLEAKDFYEKLGKKIEQVRRKGYNPRVRVISYSHGGNLCMQLGAVHVTLDKKQQFFIDELQLLGTPIQTETEYLINSPLFKRVYNFYSYADKIQTLDFFSFRRFFSKKRFENARNFSIPDKLTQFHIRIFDHKVRNSKAPNKATPYYELPNYYKEQKFDPGHFELWFMGWTILTYREKFPFNPLPSFMFLPYAIAQTQDNPHLSNDLVLRLHPALEEMQIYNYGQPRNRRNKYIYYGHVCSQKLLQQLKTRALLYKPFDYTLSIYNSKMQNAINIAHHEKHILETFEKQQKRNIKNLHKSVLSTKNKKKSPINLHAYSPATYIKKHLA